MKALLKNDLILLLCASDKGRFFEDDIAKLFNKFGDDWYIDGNSWRLTNTNRHMTHIRNHLVMETEHMKGV